MNTVPLISTNESAKAVAAAAKRLPKVEILVMVVSFLKMGAAANPRMPDVLHGPCQFRQIAGNQSFLQNEPILSRR
jgi:hypothetical protein